MLDTGKVHRSFLALSIAAIAVLSAPVIYLRLPAAHLERALKIGFRHTPPYHYPDDRGSPTGPAVDLVREAARRRSIHLEWTYSPEGPEKALSSGAVDLWPVVADLPERRAFLYISPPWAKETYSIVVPGAM